MESITPSLYNAMIGAYPKTPHENEELYTNFGTPRYPHKESENEDATIRKKRYLIPF